jgi:hypothetical protein
MVYYTIDTNGEDIFDNFILIDRSQIKEYTSWIDKWSLSHADTIPAIYGKPKKKTSY